VGFLLRNKSGLLVIYSKSNTDIQTKKETNMEINKTNKQAVHDVLLTELQKRIFKQYNARKDTFNLTDEDYDNIQTMLVDKVLQCSSIRDVNNLLLEYIDLFDGEKIYNHIFTQDGTMNYVLSLLVENAKLNKCKC